MLDRGMGQLTYGEVRQEFSRRVTSGEFCTISHKEGRAAPQYTTAEMVRMEKAIIAGMQQGNHGDFMLVSPQPLMKSFLRERRSSVWRELPEQARQPRYL
jgi:hypothetical protein